ncbi:MAG TPA: ABC transporter permease [Candidatus Mediterraneibacter stercoravium]|uniref:ABC transporter permease n=1 Tax=Candidatus Mediterraneibacter stercoravium TaxID=2838685 RepID=A0A9D2GBF0_9FIRM|nr:ABC transporter permease [Candidatus Mediterraneibacter stercoravium]
MTRSKVLAKLRERNKGHYRMLAFCIFLSVLLIGAFALMYFGPTVQDFLPEGGDTRKMAVLLMGATAVGCAIFTLYASMLFFRYKSREYGIFLALGEKKRNLNRMLFRELSSLTVSASLAGLAVAVPVSWLIWKLFELFLVSTDEMVYRLGIRGFLVGAGFALVLTLLLGVAGYRFVRCTDIMKILRTRHQPEMVKKIPSWTLPAGIVMIPLGIILALGIPQMSVYLLGKSAPSVTNLFYIPSVAGIYLVLLNIVGGSRQKNRKRFYKNMVSVSLMRFSARSATRNMCVIVLLLFACLFAFSFGLTYFDSGSLGTMENTRGFAMHYPSGENRITKKEIFDMAEKYGVQIQGYAEDSAADLVISYNTTDYTEDGSYVAVDLDDAKTALFLAEETWQKLTGREAEVESGTYRTVITPGYKENIWEHVDGLYRAANPDTGTEKELAFVGTLEDGNLPLMSDPYVYVIDNRDYRELTEGISGTWTEQIVMFDVDDLEGSYPFAKTLYAMYIEGASEETFVMTLYDRWEEERAQEAGEEYAYSGLLDVTPDNTQLFNEWKYVPDFRIVYSQDILQSISVYVMLCLYIFIITLATAAVMTYVRGISVASDNREVFLSLKKLGADASYRKWVLKSQLAKIFTYPGVLGCAAGMIFVLAQNWINDRRYSASEMKNFGILGVVCVLVLLFFYAIYRKVKKKAEEIVL